MSNSEARAAIVIVNYRTPELTIRCLEALVGERNALDGMEVVVVDGGSGDGSADVLQAALDNPRYDGWVSFLPLDFNGGFGWANNQAMLRLMQRENPPAFIHLLNPDTVIQPGAVTHLLQAMLRHERCGAAGSQLLEEEGSAAASAFRFPSIAREFVAGSNTPFLGRLFFIKPLLVEGREETKVDWVTGASVMLRVDALKESGLFDDGFFLYFEEVELMHRLRRRGWEVRHVPQSLVLHVGGASTGVGSGKAAEHAILPPYWYKSRRRFFTLVYGRQGAVAAGIAWLTGYILWRIRSALGLGQSKRDTAAEAAALLEYGLWPSRSDLEPAIADWRDAPGKMPHWSLYDR